MKRNQLSISVNSLQGVVASRSDSILLPVTTVEKMIDVNTSSTHGTTRATVARCFGVYACAKQVADHELLVLLFVKWSKRNEETHWHKKESALT